MQEDRIYGCQENEEPNIRTTIWRMPNVQQIKFQVGQKVHTKEAARKQHILWSNSNISLF